MICHISEIEEPISQATDPLGGFLTFRTGSSNSATHRTTNSRLYTKITNAEGRLPAHVFVAATTTTSPTAASATSMSIASGAMPRRGPTSTTNSPRKPSTSRRNAPWSVVRTTATERATGRRFTSPESVATSNDLRSGACGRISGVGRASEYREILRALPSDARVEFLRAHSGLPGPRGNLELMQAAADVGEYPWFRQLTEDADEYLAATGAVGLGQVLAQIVPATDPAETEIIALLYERAADERWRVREGVAMALQRLGDADPVRLWALARDWAADTDPLVQRAAVAGVCEPRLLRPASAAATALEICRIATDRLTHRPADERRSPSVRTLRQALGYCWSIAIAADPSAGLPAFRQLAGSTDPDVAWIVRENGRKARLSRLLAVSTSEHGAG